MTDPATPLAQELSSAIEWWNAAGVDCEFSDDATAWLSDDATDAPESAATNDHPNRSRSPEHGQAEQTTEIPAQAERKDLLGESPPQSLAEFHDFWLSAPGLDVIGPRGRVSARGKADAEFMVLVTEPEERDSDRLLSGPQGQLLTRMLAAMGLSEDEIYVTSALPRHTPMADTAAIAASGMDTVTAHHIKLAAPKRVIAFGSNLLPLIGHELPNDAISLREINLTPSPIPLLMSEGLDSLMAMPRLKARFWRRWIEWSAGR